MSNPNKPTLADQLTGSLPIISSTARAAFVASHFILALGSGLAIMYLVIGTVSDHIPPLAAYVVAWAGSLVWYRAVENPLRKFILFAWAYRLTDKTERAALSKNLQRTGKASISVTALLVVVTLSLSLLINVDVAEAVTTEQDSTAELTQAESVTTSYNRDVDLLSQQVEAARSQDAQDIIEAKKQAEEWVKQAQLSKGAEMYRLARNGNGWAMGQIQGAVNRATAKGERYIQAAKDNATAPTLQGQLTGYVGTRSASRDTVATMTAGLVTARRMDFLQTKGRRNWMLFLAVCFVLAVFIYTSRLLVLACLETGEQLDDKEPGEGVAKVAMRKAGTVNAWLGNKLDRWGSDKFVLATVAQSVQTRTQPVPTRADTDYTDAQPVPARIEKTAETRVAQDFEGDTDLGVIQMTSKEIALLIKYCRTNYDRIETAATQSGTDSARIKFNTARTQLRNMGYKVRTGTEVIKKTVKKGGKPCEVAFKELLID